MSIKKHNFNKSFKKINEIICILDGSGSMHSQKNNTIAGFNKFLANQKESLDKDTKTLLTVSVFREGFSPSNQFHASFINPWDNLSYTTTSSVNNSLELDAIYNRVDVREAQYLTTSQYKTDSGTPLYDALGSVISTAQSTIDADKHKPHSVLVVIVTDGEENSSKTWNNETIKALIDSKKASNWNFLFLGADINNFDNSCSIGLKEYSLRTTSGQRGYEEAWTCINNVATSCNLSASGMYSGADLNDAILTCNTVSKVD